MHLRRTIYLLLISLGYSTASFAEDLWQVYQLSVANDSTLQAAQAALKANRQIFPEALAQMVPNIAASYNTTGTDDTLNFLGAYNTKSYGITLTQPIFHPEHWAQLEQARHVVKGAVATYLSTAQELIIRVADQYFNILGAIDDLHFAQSKRKAFARELEQSQQRFEVGLIAITDVQNAKARHDSAVSEEITAQNAVFDQYEKLREITGQPITEVSLFPTNKTLALLPPNPNEQEAWVNTAHQYNLAVLVAKEGAEQQKAAIGVQVAGHFPKFDLQGSLQRNKPAPPYPFDQLGYSRSISLNVSVPLFAGGGVIFRTREASARYEEAQKKLETQQRVVDSNTRQAFRGILSAIGNVKALSQAVVSNKAALDATKASYEVGTRTMVDVLDAESNMLNAEREHSKARYNYILEGLKLKQAAGILTSEDLMKINLLMTNKAIHPVKIKKNE